MLLQEKEGAGEMAQWIRTYTALAKDPSPVSSTHVWYPIIVCSSSSRRSNTSGVYGHLHPLAHTHTETHTERYNQSKTNIIVMHS